jgi:hypothetical protein
MAAALHHRQHSRVRCARTANAGGRAGDNVVVGEAAIERKHKTLR